MLRPACCRARRWTPIETFVRDHAAGRRPRNLSVRSPHAGISRTDRAFHRSGGVANRDRSRIRARPPTSSPPGSSGDPADEVLLCDNEFPANAVPWIALRRRGVNVRLLQTSRERLTPDVLRREISPRTRLVAVSWVSYADGYRHDLSGSPRSRTRRGALLR